MSSPLPGMDPYIEDPEVWSDFHGALANEMRGELNTQILPRYFARMMPYVTYDIVEIEASHKIYPDVSVWHETPQGGTLAPTLTITPARVQSLVEVGEPLRLYTVEVREVKTKRLVTAIEILSPVNKRPGHETYDAYRRKRRELLQAGTHLLEIDLLRGGERPPLLKPVPPAPYYVTLSRTERRPNVEVWPIQLRDKLPVLPVPLLEPDPDAAFDLGKLVANCYEYGGYADLIDYRQPPPPPKLSRDEQEWLDSFLHERNLR